jgi:kynurenine formamidase
MAGTPVDAVRLIDELSNWGRWGADDELGTFNFVDDATRAAAAALVTDGGAVSCSWEMTDIQRFMKRSAEPLANPRRDPHAPRWHSTVDWVGFQFHGLLMTHLDALSHVFWDGLAYNGVRPEQVNGELGAQALAVTASPVGLVTRGVLLDLPAILGVAWLEPGTAVGPDLLDAAEQAAGLRIRRGDALLIRVGHGAIRRARGVEPILHGPSSGLSAACLPWLAEREVALVASDATNDVTPLVDDPVQLPVHVIGLRAMGLWLIDNAQLEDLSAACARRGRYEFLWTTAPLRLARATGSPVNPIAVF